MYRIKFILVMLFTSLLMSISYGIDYSEIFKDVNDPNYICVHNSKIEFDKRYNAWKQYIKDNGISGSSFAEDYISNEPFRKLLELGPVAVPWYIQSESSSFMNVAIHYVLRANWPELAGYTESQMRTENMYVALKNWWADVPKTVPVQFNTRMSKFRSWRSEQSPAISWTEISATDEWKGMEEMGLLGVPFLIQRVQAGIADEADYRLLMYYTQPVSFNKDNFPMMPKAIVTVAQDKANAAFWQTWWQENSWQFWWLPAIR